MGDNFRAKFLKIAAFAVLYLGLTSLNGALVAGGSPLTLQSVAKSFSAVTNGRIQNNTVATTQNIEIVISSSGYSPKYFKVRKGTPVTIKLTSKDAYSCASAFRIPSLGISKNLQANETQSLSFTPTQLGQIAFTCSMGMYNGVIEVI